MRISEQEVSRLRADARAAFDEWLDANVAERAALQTGERPQLEAARQAAVDAFGVMKDASDRFVLASLNRRAGE
jgi:hypothetical protein